MAFIVILCSASLLRSCELNSGSESVLLAPWTCIGEFHEQLDTPEGSALWHEHERVYNILVWQYRTGFETHPQGNKSEQVGAWQGCCWGKPIEKEEDF